jgi:hypothetical protein
MHARFGLVERGTPGIDRPVSPGVHLSAAESAVLSSDAPHEQTEDSGQHGSREDNVED